MPGAWRRLRATCKIGNLWSPAILLCVGVSRLLDLSPLVASLAVGATMVNLTSNSRSLFGALAKGGRVKIDRGEGDLLFSFEGR